MSQLLISTIFWADENFIYVSSQISAIMIDEIAMTTLVQTRHCANERHWTSDDPVHWQFCTWSLYQMKYFLRYWPFLQGIHRSPVNSPHKGQWHGALMFSLICAWINGWVNNREAGDLRCYITHYDVTVMINFTYVHHLLNHHFLYNLDEHSTGTIISMVYWKISSPC